ncbi:MAG: glycerol-3-phosphate dehydrogenase/oxidase [Bacteroidota bacterium]|nr:glycerol-3-phosphate dehydrogenase/oxidase [Bacteroidota bacterium]
MENNLSAASRKESITAVKNEVYDLLIIGGGITGAGIALDAASRGIKTALVEMQDYAAGTSSRSTKLVHGGLRYLEHLELGLVKEVGQEREIVHTNASHIVIPEKMVLPIIKDGSLGKFTTSIALYVYDFLAGVKKEEHRRMLSREETVKRVPLIDSDLLKSGALYYEYKTDDSRLTVEVLKKANEYGVQALNYTEVTDFEYSNNKVTGVKVQDKITGENYSIQAKHTVNSTGPWVDKLRQKDNSLEGKHLQHSKGVHIVVSKKDFPLNHAIYFDTGDERMVFAIPRFDIVYIGTTDTFFEGNLKNPGTTQEDVDYLLEAVNRIAPSVKLNREQVKSVWSGLRPLIHEDGKDPSELSRKDEIFYSDSGLISIAGGKLTGYRIMAKNVTKEVMKRLADTEGRKYVSCQTKNMRLSGGEFPFYPTEKSLNEFFEKKYDQVHQVEISPEEFKKLFFRYGMNIDKISEKAFDYYNETKNSQSAWLKAEVRYSIFYEGAVNISDFFIRRTGLIFFQIDEIDSIMDETQQYFTEFLNLSETQSQQDIKNLKEEIKSATSYA